MEIQGMKFLGHSDMGGRGDGMQIAHAGKYLFVGHMKPGEGTAILDVGNPRDPRMVGQLPDYAGTWSPKVQVVGDLMLVNYEQRGENPSQRAGFSVFDISNPAAPREIVYEPVPHRGVHRMWWTGGRYAYMSGIRQGFNARMLMIWDMQDPARPREVGLWWLPGTKEGESSAHWPAGKKHNVHHALTAGNRAYVGCWDAGFTILDVDDPTAPQVVSALNWPAAEGGHTHTAMPLPGRNLLIVTDEATDNDYEPKHIRIIDIADDRAPQVLSRFPVPQGDYLSRGGRFGPHNLHEHRPGAYVNEDLIFATWYSGGLSVVDISDPRNPRDVARFVPDAPPGQSSCQINDVYVDNKGLIYTTDRGNGGLCILCME